jgi:hypothetical protein
MASIDRVMALAEEIKKKKKDKNYEISPSTINTLDLANDIRSGNKNALKDYVENNDGIFDAPLKNFVEEEKTEEEPTKKRTWFNKSGVFDDGYDFGDVSKAILGTYKDIKQDVSKGLLKIGEGVLDTAMYVVGDTAKRAGDERTAKNTSEFIERDWIEESKASNIIANFDEIAPTLIDATKDYFKNKDANVYVEAAKKILGDDFEEDSVLGDKSDSLVQSAGQLGGTIVLQAVGVPWWITTGTTTFGGEVQNAFQQDATYEEAGFSGLVSAGAEILFEKLSGGISFGGSTLDEVWKKPLMEKISNKTLKVLLNYGIDMVGEGFEEVATEFVSTIGSQLSYEREETWNELINNEEAMDKYIEQVADSLFGEQARENYREAFVGGAVLSGGANVGKVQNSIKTGRDYNTGLTDNEQAVVDAEVAKRTEGKNLDKKQITKIEAEVKEDLEKGYISTDTIESTLGGDTYNSLKSIRDNKTNLETQIRELENKPNAEITVAEMEQLNDYREQLKSIDTNTLETQLQSEMGSRIKSDDYLQRSYVEKAKRGQEFTYKVAETDSEFKRGVYESTKGKLNNTNRSHETVEAVAKLSEDRKMQYKFTNNAELQKMGLAKKGKTANGLYVVEKDGKREILINTDSKKYIEAVLVHETAHDFKNTSPETYTKLVDITKEFAKAQNDYARVYSEVAEMYKNIKDANIDEEVTSRLLEDYLGNKDFIESLTTKEPSIVKKIIDEIKYLYKKFTASSPEARKLLELQHDLEKTFREAYKQTDIKTKEVFENSKVRDDKGKLKKVYHGTRADFDTYDINRSGENYKDGWSNSGKGLYFTEDMAEAEQYAKDSTQDGDIKVKEAYLNIENPFDTSEDYSYLTEMAKEYNIEPYYLERGDRLLNWFKNNNIDVGEVLNKYGFDGIVDHGHYVVFDNNQILNADGTRNVQYSLSEATDNQGRKLSEQQIEHFKDSKARDENESLVTVYHTMTDTGVQFNEFNPVGTGGYRFGDQIVNYYTDSKDMSGSYADQKYNMADTKKLNSIEDAKKWLEDNRFSGNRNYDYDIKTVQEGIIRVTLYDFDTGNVINALDFSNEAELLRNIKGKVNGSLGDITKQHRYQYEGYVNITNPYVVDADGNRWSSVQSGIDSKIQEQLGRITNTEKQALSQLANESVAKHNELWNEESDDKYRLYKRVYDNSLTTQEKNEIVYNRLGSELTSPDKEVYIDGWIGNSRYQYTETLKDFATTYNQLVADYSTYGNPQSYFTKNYKDMINTNKIEDITSGELFDIAYQDFREAFYEDVFAKDFSTNDIVYRVIEMNKNGANYDGIIINNVVDYGGHTDLDQTPNNLYITFSSEQFKAWDNENPTADKDFRYSLSEESSIDDIINSSMTMEEARNMIQRTFMINDIYNWYDGKYQNGDEWFKGEGIDEVTMYAENTQLILEKFLNKIYDKDIGYGDDFYLESILEAYENGTLVGTEKQKAQRLDISLDTNYQDSRFYAPQRIEAGIELYEKASQRVTNKNRQEVYKARADFIIAAHQKGYAESIGLTQEEANKKIKSWANYTKNAMELSNSVNEGVAFQNRWSGLENSSIVNTISVSNEDLAKMVKEIKGDSNGWQRDYITSTMLALDTHIDYKSLTFEFDQHKVLSEKHAAGDYDSRTDVIRIGHGYQNTVAHEIGHYIDSKWARDLGLGNRYLSDGRSNIDNLTTEQKQFYNNFSLFIEDISNSAYLGSEYSKNNEYWQRNTEVFARFVGKFTEWTKNQATNNRYGYEDKFYKDNFTERQYREFIKLLQEKSMLDTTHTKKYNTYNQNLINTIDSINETQRQQLTNIINDENTGNIPTYQITDRLIETLGRDTYFALGKDRITDLVKNDFYKNAEYSLSNESDIAPTSTPNQTATQDIRLEEAIAPLQEEIATLIETVTDLRSNMENAISKVVPTTDEFAPMTEADLPMYEQQSREAFNEAVRESARAVERDLGYVPQNPTQESTYNEMAKVLTEEPKTANERNQRKLAIIAANVLDKGLVFENVSLKNKNRELMGKWDYTLTSEARAQTAIGQGHYDNATGKTISKSLNAIMEEVNNTGLTKQFYEYIYHKHNVDRMQLADKFEGMENKPVFGEDVTAADSQEIVNQYEFSNPEFKRFAKDVYDYVNADRKLLVDNGVISQETADLWAKMYPHYVPIRRAGHTGNAINVPLDTGRTGINAPIKKATGGSSDILPLFDTMASRTLQTYRATAKNSFGVELMKTLGTKIESTTTNVDEVIDSVDAQEGLLKENNGKPTFTVFENGEKITFSITKDMYDALKPLSDSSILSKTIKPLNIASSFHRGLLTQYNPIFALTNGIKDIQDILINSQHFAKTYAKIPEAYKQVLEKGYWYQEYMANGGEHNSYFDSQDNTFKTENTGLYKLLDAPPLKQIAQLNDFIEIIPRLSEYIASREMGRSIEVSMLDAARVTTNFKAGGNLTKFLNRNGATFLNASVQGAMQQVRNIREAQANGVKGWANLAIKFTIAGLPALLLNALLWQDDEEYEELSDYVKQNYYIVWKTDDGKFIRIPKGRTVAVIQEAVEQTKNFITGDDEVDLASFIDLFLTNLAPSNPIENNVFAPIIQVANNKTWYGEDLVPTRLQNLPAAEQYDESTDIFSRWLGELLDVSPYKINYLLDQYSDGVGDVILPMLTPEAESGDDSFLGNLFAPLKSKFTTDSVMNNQNVSDFYSTSEELTVNANKNDATDEDILKNKYFNSVKAEMNELYAEKREIQNSDLPASEKYQRVREIQSQINDISKNALNSYEDVDIQSNYATVGDRQFKVGSDGEWEKISDKQLEKQNAVTEMYGISPNEYWSKKEEYDFAYENPSKYATVTTITDYSTYKIYSDDIYNIKADKDENGKSISGSRKVKVFDYINNLDLSFEQKVMLAKMYYPSYDEYNYEIIDYLNNRDDISYEQMVSILTELGFTVKPDGTVEWD